jgi:hypothetical protein
MPHGLSYMLLIGNFAVECIIIEKIHLEKSFDRVLALTELVKKIQYAVHTGHTRLASGRP